MMKRVALGSAWVVVLAAVGGCGSDKDIGMTDAPAGCIPGSESQCTCIDGSPSTQMCDGAGTQFFPCACDYVEEPPIAMVPMDPTQTMNPPPMDTIPDPSGMDPATMEPPAPPPPSLTGDVPDTPHCAPVANWDPMWVQWEEEVLVLTNQKRSQPQSCGPEGSFQAAGPLVMNPYLRCSARLHALDMGQKGYFAHESQDGRTPFDRMQMAGYSGGFMGENIAQGQTSPTQVVNGWMDSPGHCRNMMQADFKDLGVGFYQGAGGGGGFGVPSLYWVQNFGSTAGGSPSGGGGGGDPNDAFCPGAWWCPPEG